MLLLEKLFTHLTRGERMIKILKITAMFITIIAGIAAIIGVYIQTSTHKPIVEIKTITKDKLTDLPAIDGLKAKFSYKNNVVNSLWKLNYLIINSGDELIIGKGNKKNIIKENLTFSLPKNYKILEISNLNDNFQLKQYPQSNKFEISFLQWKPNEALEVSIYAEQLKNSKNPDLTTNGREIVNGEVQYSALHNTIKVKKQLFEYLPKIFQYLLWWIVVIILGLFVLVLPIVWLTEVIKFIKYNQWYKANYIFYEEWANTLVEKGAITSCQSPRQLPKNLWAEFPEPKPTLPDDDFGSMTLAFVAISAFTLATLLIIIKI